MDAYYGEVQALDDVSLRVDEGEVVGLLGRNGSGKTTVFRTVMGFVEPATGRVEHRGEDVTGLRPPATSKRGISLVPAERRAFPRLTVRENLRLAVEGQNGDPSAVDAALDRFPTLASVADQHGQALSGGQQQLLAIARGLIGDTDVLLLDEPLEGISPEYVDVVRDAIAGIVSEGTTVVVIDHDIDTVLEVSDRAYVLKSGRVADEAASETFLADRDRLARRLGIV